MIIDVFGNLNNQTRLLESLNWDEEQLQVLLQYLHEVLNDETILHPHSIITHIKEHFTEQAADEISQIFEEISATCNFFKGDDCEH